MAMEKGLHRIEFVALRIIEHAETEGLGHR